MCLCKTKASLRTIGLPFIQLEATVLLATFNQSAAILGSPAALAKAVGQERFTKINRTHRRAKYARIQRLCVLADAVLRQ